MRVANGEEVHHGDRLCEHGACDNGAYFVVRSPLDGRSAYLCGVHRKKRPLEDTWALPKRSKTELALRAQATRVAHDATVEQAAVERKGAAGPISLFRMRMLKSPGLLAGVLNIYPNFKHGGRTDGFGCPSLSPMSLGPVRHGQPDLPPAANIENFHQLAGKCWREECIAAETPLVLEDYPGAPVNSSSATGPRLRPGPLYATNRLAGLLNPTPQRHKYRSSEDAKNPNVPVCFVWVDKQRKEHLLTYVHSRQFYCTFYSRLASLQPAFQQLLQWRAEGKALRICGYDGFPIDESRQTFEQAYLDPSVPFGHERVLCCMLRLPEVHWPWLKYKTFDF